PVALAIARSRGFGGPLHDVRAEHRFRETGGNEYRSGMVQSPYLISPSNHFFSVGFLSFSAFFSASVSWRIRKSRTAPAVSHVQIPNGRLGRHSSRIEIRRSAVSRSTSFSSSIHASIFGLLTRM